MTSITSDNTSSNVVNTNGNGDGVTASIYTAARHITPHFQTGEYVPHTSFVPDDIYAICLDNVVKVCNDILVEWKGKILLGQRNVYPQKSWWFGCGGRMLPGETRVEATRRLLRRELAVHIDANSAARINTVGHYSFLWKMREQAPKDNGTADISAVAMISLTDDEVAGIKLDQKEYDDRAWVSPSDIVAGSAKYHPALKRVVNDYLRIQLYQRLEKLALGGIRSPPIAGTETKAATATAATTTATSTDTTVDGVSDAEIVGAVKDYLRFAAAISANDHLTSRTEEER